MNPTITIDAGLVAGVGTFAFLFVQNVKRYRWFDNNWGLPAAMIVSLVVVAVGLLAAGKLTAGDWLAVYNQLLGGLEAGMAAAAGYRVQRPLGVFEPAPDTDQPGTPYGPGPVAPSPIPPLPPAVPFPHSIPPPPALSVPPASPVRDVKA